MKIRIDHQCPQCGAPAELEETDRLFSCQYCRVQSYLYHKDYFECVLPSKAPSNTDIFFMPYWRFKGMIFSCINKHVEHRFIDTSLQAFQSLLFPASVGLRGQSLKLRFVTPDTKGYFIKPQIPFHQAMSAFMNRFNTSADEEIQHQAHIGETVSIIYSPFYAGTKLYDAVLNEVIKDELPAGFNLSDFPGGAPQWSLGFIPTLCPHCGWDMKGERDTHALMCTNCSSVWIPYKNKLKQIRFGCSANNMSHAVYFPFWRIKADITGISLASYADLIHIANLPKAIQKGWNRISFYFWVPGFKVRPKTFLMLLSHMTTTQPMDELHTQLPDQKIFPATLPAEEAVETLKINLTSFMKNDTLFNSLDQITIKPRNILLALIPFQEGFHDYIQPQYQISINKNQLALSGNL